MANISKGEFNNQTAKILYKQARELVDALIKSNKLDPKDAEQEWARIVADKLKSHGFPVPKEIAEKII